METGASAPYAHLARNTSAADKLLLKQNDVQINISGGFTIKIFAGTWIRTREGGVVAQWLACWEAKLANLRILRSRGRKAK